MTNIVITTAAITLTLSLPAGAVVSVMENNQEIANFTASENQNQPDPSPAPGATPLPQGQPIEQINVIVEIHQPETGVSPLPSVSPSPSPEPTILPGNPAQPTAILGTPVPTPLSSAQVINPGTPPSAQISATAPVSKVPQPVVNNFSNVPQPKQMMDQTGTTQNGFTYNGVPFQPVRNGGEANPTVSPSPQPVSQPATSTGELEQLRQEVAQLRQQLQQSSTPAPTPTPTPQSTVTTTTQVNPATGRPVSQTITTVQQGTPTPTPTPRVTTPQRIVGAVPSASAPRAR